MWRSSAELRRMACPTPWPCCEPHCRVCRTSMSRVPCISSTRGGSGLSPMCPQSTRLSSRAPEFSCMAGAPRIMISVTENNRHEQAVGSRAGDVGPADSEDSRSGAAARLCGEPEPEPGLRGGAAGERRVALPGAAQAGAAGLDRGGVEDQRAGTPREVLLADARGAGALEERDRRLG